MKVCKRDVKLTQSLSKDYHTVYSYNCKIDT